MRDCSLSEFSIDIFRLHVTGSSGSETEGEREGAGLPNKSPLVWRSLWRAVNMGQWLLGVTDKWSGRNSDQVRAEKRVLILF